MFRGGLVFTPPPPHEIATEDPPRLEVAAVDRGSHLEEVSDAGDASRVGSLTPSPSCLEGVVVVIVVVFDMVATSLLSFSENEAHFLLLLWLGRGRWAKGDDLMSEREVP